MKNIVSALIVVVCIIAGGVGGHFLKSGQAGAPEANEHAATSEAASAEDGHGSDHSAKPKKGDSHSTDKKASPDGAGGYYFKFTREFIVPIMEGDRVKSLVILNINLETDPSKAQTLFSMEPKLRDNIMTTLIGLSNDGVTFESLTNVESYETIRSTILMNLKSVVATGIENVLILDMARQDL